MIRNVGSLYSKLSPKLINLKCSNIQANLKDINKIDRLFCTFNGPKTNLFNVQCSRVNIAPVRYRRNRKKASTETEDSDDDNEDADEDNVEENPLLSELFETKDDGRKELTVEIASLRLDVVCKSCFQISRTKVDEYFSKGNIYVNKEPAEKRSQQVYLNDEIDVFTRLEDNQKTSFRRLHIVELPDKVTNKDRMKIKVHRWDEIEDENF